jgi:NusA-like KH domain protein
MAKTIDMQFIRYINLFEKFSRVSTTNCFIYNNTLFFAVPKSKLFQAIGTNGNNIKKIGDILRKRVKIVEMPSEVQGVNKFVRDVVYPVEFDGLEVNGKEVVISATMQNRAMLIGRGRVREAELLEILNKSFGIDKIKIGP